MKGTTGGQMFAQSSPIGRKPAVSNGGGGWIRTNVDRSRLIYRPEIIELNQCPRSFFHDSFTVDFLRVTAEGGQNSEAYLNRIPLLASGYGAALCGLLYWG